MSSEVTALLITIAGSIVAYLGALLKISAQNKKNDSLRDTAAANAEAKVDDAAAEVKVAALRQEARNADQMQSMQKQFQDFILSMVAEERGERQRVLEKFDQLMADKLSLQGQVQTLSRQYEEAYVAAMRRDQEIGRLTGKLDISVSEIGHLAQQVADLSHNNETLESKNHELADAYKQLLAENRDLVKQNEQFETEKKHLEIRITELEDQVQELRALNKKARVDPAS